ncbi:unnamed protein product [Camellia sinensis]
MHNPKTSICGVLGTSLPSPSSGIGGGGEEKSKHKPLMYSYDEERSWEVSWWYSTSWFRHWFSLVKFAFSFANLDFSASSASN